MPRRAPTCRDSIPGRASRPPEPAGRPTSRSPRPDRLPQALTHRIVDPTRRTGGSCPALSTRPVRPSRTDRTRAGSPRERSSKSTCRPPFCVTASWHRGAVSLTFAIRPAAGEGRPCMQGRMSTLSLGNLEESLQGLVKCFFVGAPAAGGKPSCKGRRPAGGAFRPDRDFGRF